MKRRRQPSYLHVGLVSGCRPQSFGLGLEMQVHLNTELGMQHCSGRIRATRTNHQNNSPDIIQSQQLLTLFTQQPNHDLNLSNSTATSRLCSLYLSVYSVYQQVLPSSEGLFSKWTRLLAEHNVSNIVLESHVFGSSIQHLNEELIWLSV